MSFQNTSHLHTDLDRHDRLLRERLHDPYHAKLKIKEPSICPECGAVFHKGRWSWGEAPTGAHSALCPACTRSRDEIPAAYLTLRGAYLFGHREEIMQLARNHEQRERAEHPLKRIMAVEDIAGGIRLSFTEAHLARDIGEALHHAYKGELAYHYADEDIMLRVNWSRDL
jgi:NMD protein affecting ribosome stability and mRNA decay